MHLFGWPDKDSVARIVVVGTWSVYVINFLISLPIPDVALVTAGLAFLSALFGITAVVMVAMNRKGWRKASMIAGAVFLATYGFRIGWYTWNEMQLPVSQPSAGVAFLNVWRSSSKITAHLYGNFGLGSALNFAFPFFLMPLAQLYIVLLLVRSNAPRSVI